MKKILSILAGLILIPTTAFAFHFQSGDELYINEAINDDAYMAGGMVRVEENINGDLVAAGGSLTLNGDVSEDLTLASGDITVNGAVGGDARLAGGNIKINSVIGDDLLVGSGNLELGKNSVIGGDFIFGSGNVLMNGIINGDIKGAGGSIYINGEINGDVNLSEVEQVKFGPEGKITGNLSYSSEKQLEIEEGVVGGEISYKGRSTISSDDAEWISKSFFAGFSIFKLFSMLLFGLFLVWLFHRYSINAFDHTLKSPLRNLGMGLLFVILMPIVALIFLISIIGIPITAVIVMIFAISLIIAKVFAALLIGWKIIPMKSKSSFGRMYGGYALGTFIYVALGLIPFAGWLLQALLILVALGGMMSYEQELFQHLRKKKLI